MTTSSLSCNICGNVNPSQAAFCLICGEPLEASVPSPSNLTGLLFQDQLLQQRYRILVLVGRGGFAAVYQAQDTHLRDRRVAVKEMSQSGLSSKELSEAVEAFQREAQLLAGLLHPNLPRIYDHFSERGRWYLVMDFIEGETVEDFLLRQPDHRLSLQETLDIGLQVCSVLDYLHTRRPPIIFRDLKPANIMRGPSGHLYLIDFGIARHFKPGQMKDTIAFGSPGYAAPEQYGKAQTTPQSDIYSLGVLLHHLLSGSDPAEKPFLLPPLRLYGAAMTELENLITRMMALDAERRPTSVAEVQAELQVIAARSSAKWVDIQSQGLPREEMHTARRPGERERSEAQQEQVLLPPVNPLRRKLILGGALTGIALAVGAGGLLTFLPRLHGKPRPAVLPTVRQPAAIGHFGSDVMFGFDAPHTNFNSSEKQLSPANVSRLKLAWHSEAIGKNYFSSPVVSGDSVYVVTYDGRLWAFNVTSGQTRWVSDPPQSIVPGLTGSPSTVAVVEGVVYFCLQDRKLYAFDAVTGHLRWVSPTSNAYSSPTVVNGVIYSTDGEAVYAFDAVTGHLRWASSPMASNASPVAVANHLVYAAISGNGASLGRVYALNAATGQTHWISDLIENGIDDNSSPAVANGLVYIGSGDGGLVAFDAATGHTRWVTGPTAGSTGSSPAVAHGKVYHARGQVYAFDAMTGQALWVSDDVGAFDSDSTLVANGVVYSCSAENESVYALDATTGKTLWVSPPANAQIATTPAVANGMVYLASGSNGGPVYAFRLPT
ncbi:MAG: hypothetical protein NVSMB27_37220 [Ktedonobacteraceae bacterium]